jgi:hypothetical protein
VPVDRLRQIPAGLPIFAAGQGTAVLTDFSAAKIAARMGLRMFEKSQLVRRHAQSRTRRLGSSRHAIIQTIKTGSISTSTPAAAVTFQSPLSARNELHSNSSGVTTFLGRYGPDEANRRR